MSHEDNLNEETITDGGIVYLRHHKLSSNDAQTPTADKNDTDQKKIIVTHLTCREKAQQPGSMKAMNVDRVKSKIQKNFNEFKELLNPLNQSSELNE